MPEGELGAYDATHHRPLALIINSSGDYAGKVVYRGKGQFANIIVVHDDSPALVKIDGQLDQREVVRGVVRVCEVIREEPRLEERVLKNLFGHISESPQHWSRLY